MAMRATKSGDAYRLEQKMEATFDDQEKLGFPAAVINWINRCLEGEVPACAGTTWQDIQTHLKDGSVLCRVMNKLLAHAGKGKISFKAKAPQPFVALGNLQTFNDGAKTLGMKDTDLFQPPDLYEGRKGPMLNVINALSTLGFKSNNNGFQPKYEPPEAPKPEW